jgi:hypothetical protein
MINGNINKIKDPHGILVYAFYWKKYLPENAVIDEHWLTVNDGIEEDGGITISNDYHTDTEVFFLASGGVLGKEYDVTCKIRYGVEEDDRTMKIIINNR